jgi:hypothetical protein
MPDAWSTMTSSRPTGWQEGREGAELNFAYHSDIAAGSFERPTVARTAVLLLLGTGGLTIGSGLLQ